MSASSSYVPFHSQVDPVYFETSNNLQIQQERSKFSQTRGIQCTPSSDMVKVELQDSELWRKFHHLTNEMIVNKQGRRIFPVFRFKIFDLKPDAIYNVWMDIANTDGQHYKRKKNQWKAVGPGEPHVHRNFYLHPLSPCSGKMLMGGQLVSFYKMKLTNSFSNLSAEKVFVRSQHHYQPRLHISHIDGQSGLQLEPLLTFTFDETSFIAVTAYHNELVSQLKIDNNPYARGFRTDGGKASRKRKVPEKDAPMLSSSSSQGSSQIASNESSSKRLKKQSCEAKPSPTHQTEASLSEPLNVGISTSNTSHLPACNSKDDPPHYSSPAEMFSEFAYNSSTFRHGNEGLIWNTFAVDNAADSISLSQNDNDSRVFVEGSRPKCLAQNVTHHHQEKPLVTRYQVSQSTSNCSSGSPDVADPMSSFQYRF